MCSNINTKSLSTTCTKGFTLVELAIVITLIAIITGGIIQGAKMLENVRILRTIKDIESYRVATEMFVGAYKQLPGDLEEAHLKIPGCTEVCNTENGITYSGDWIVGETIWSLITFQSWGLKDEA